MYAYIRMCDWVHVYIDNKNTIYIAQESLAANLFLQLAVLRTNLSIFPFPNCTEHRRTTSLSVKLAKCHIYNLSNPPKFWTKLTTNVLVLYGNIHFKILHIYSIIGYYRNYDHIG